MIKENQIESLMAEFILGVVKNPENETTVKVFCEETHINRDMVTKKKFFRMRNSTLFRIMMGIAHLSSLEEYLTLCLRFAIITYCVAHLDDGSPEAIMKAHSGSPIGRNTNTSKN